MQLHDGSPDLELEGHQLRLEKRHLERWNQLGLGYGLNPSLPPVLVEFQTSCALIITNPQMFPTLGCGKHQKRYLYTAPNRERRPERLYTVARLLAVLGGATDLLSLSDGRRTNGVCHPLTELQIGELLGIAAHGDEDLEHDTTGMRAMRSALEDAESAGFVTRAQPKVQYCSAEAGGCGKKIQRGRSCRCGRRHAWRWRSLPTIISITKDCFEAFGLKEALEEQQGERYQDQQSGLTGPRPEKDVRIERETRRVFRAQALAAKRAQLVTHHDPKLVAYLKAQLDRLGKKNE